MKAIWTILLLIASNVFMTFAWYGHLKLQEMKISSNWPLILVILFSWAVAFLEYCAQVPANRIGAKTMSLEQLKIVQEAVSLLTFVPFSVLVMKEAVSWNYVAAAFCIFGAVYFIFK